MLNIIKYLRQLLSFPFYISLAILNLLIAILILLSGFILDTANIVSGENFELRKK